VTALLAQEMKEAVDRVLKRVAVDYAIPYDDLFAKYLADDVEILSSKLEHITIKRSVPRPDVPPEDRCMARTWNAGRGGQCKKRHAADQEYCKAHAKAELKYGRIDQAAPAGVFNKPGKREKMY
jgi:hypothetical protein